MEPMTLGSPVGSPGSPTTSPYLPAFLMGEPATSPGSISMTKNPPLTGKQLSFGTSPTAHGMSPTVETRVSRLSTPVLHAAEKGSGPPTRGLFDVEEDTLSNVQSPLPNISTRLNASTVLNTTPAPTFSVSTPTYSDGYWVTVFGFPSSAASHILSQFSQYGTVLASRSSPRGNWLHIKYQSSIEARKALSNNGKVFGGTFMVAVMPCKDPDVLMDGADKENQMMDFFSPSSSFQRSSTSAFRGADLSTHSRIPTPFPGPRRVVLQENPLPSRYRSLGDEEELVLQQTRAQAPSFGTPTSPRQATARPLTQAYRAAQHPSEVVCTHSMPQRSTSLMGKAMEYFFGW